MNIVSAMSTFLTSADLEGKTVVVTIKYVDMQKVGDKQEEKPIIFTEGLSKKGIVMNVGKREVLIAAYGEETTLWAGQQLSLTPGTTQYGGKTVACIDFSVPVDATDTNPFD